MRCSGSRQAVGEGKSATELRTENPHPRRGQVDRAETIVAEGSETVVRTCQRRHRDDVFRRITCRIERRQVVVDALTKDVSVSGSRHNQDLFIGCRLDCDAERDVDAAGLSPTVVEHTDIGTRLDPPWSSSRSPARICVA